MSHSASIYLHIPFCTTRCTYCAFNTYTQLETLIPHFVEAFCTEIKLIGANTPYSNVHTIYFGGGTPSLLKPAQFNTILDALHAAFPISTDCEISIEANPNDLTERYLSQLRSLGINRLSIGMQSSNSAELKLFKRDHQQDTVVGAVSAARRAGFDNLSLDLIYGVPGQTMDTWQSSVKALLALTPEHVSMYALGLEDGTPMKNWVLDGRLSLPDDDLAADMYDVVTDMLDFAGYRQYEISNWAKPDFACKHNIQYWRNLPYIGLGPGAHGYAAGYRYSTILSPQRYIKLLSDEIDAGQFVFPQSPVTREASLVTRDDEIAETLMTGLRLVGEGISLVEFQSRFGVDLLDLHGSTLQRMMMLNVLTIDKGRVYLTRQGRLLSNQIFRELV